MVAGTCDTEELTPIQSPRLCNTWIPRADDTDSFIQFDLGTSTEVFVNSYRVSYSDDGDNFNFIIDQILGQPQVSLTEELQRVQFLVRLGLIQLLWKQGSRTLISSSAAEI